jgi:hypothetical protein
MLQHVAIIVRFCHVEERVSNEEILGYHCFKNDRVTFWMPIVLPLPRKWTILLLPMHAINARKYPWKSPWTANSHDSSCVIGIWSFQTPGRTLPQLLCKTYTLLQDMWILPCECVHKQDQQKLNPYASIRTTRMNFWREENSNLMVESFFTLK